MYEHIPAALKHGFRNDYSEGAHPRLLQALAAASTEQNRGYGLDAHTERAIGLIRSQMNAAVESTMEQVLLIERDNQRVLGRSDDFKEAIAAFAEKRKPQFKGRCGGARSL